MRMPTHTVRPILPFAIPFLAAVQLDAANAVTPGEFVVERPTLICLGFEWKIGGDDNRDSSVELSYRKSGESVWKRGMPLLRMGGEEVFRRDMGVEYIVPHGFAGSILDLEPGTEYEVRLELHDPDGVNGEAIKTAKARTRSEPTAATGGRVLHVYPPGWKGKREEPSFTGIKDAYYGSGRGDWSVVSPRPVRPGDIIEVHAGLYKSDRLNYSDPLGLPFDGTYVLSAKGTPEKPIVIRAAGDGEVILDGDGAHRLFDVMGADYHIFEGLTIRNTDVAFYAGTKHVGGSSGLTVRNCRIEDAGIGVVTQYAGSRDYYIADNVFLGRDDPQRLLGWYNPGIYGANELKSFFAVKVYGSGHVVAHNYIAYFHDGICISTYGTPETEQDRKAVAIDFYNNDIHLMADDFIEADGGVHNIRIMRNRGVNAAQCGLSAQPVYGGPAYYIRNVIYNVATGRGLKFQVKPAGLIVYHNTFLAEARSGDMFSNAHFRNNLFLGNDAPGRGILGLANATAYSSYDYDGYRPNRDAKNQFEWRSPPQGVARDYESPRDGAASFGSLAEFQSGTGQEAHAIELDYDVFEKMSPPDPSDPYAVYHAGDLDFRIKPSSRAVDAGVAIPNVNDNRTGSAPDLGAYEVGQPEPHYGPRTQPAPGRRPSSK